MQRLWGKEIWFTVQLPGKKRKKSLTVPPHLISSACSGNRNQCDCVQSKITLVGIRGPGADRREGQDGRTRGEILVRDRSAGVAA